MLQTSRLYLALWSLNLIKFCLVSAINLDISPSTVVLQSQSPPKTSFECNTISANDIDFIYKITLSKVSEFGDEQVFAIAKPGRQQFTTDTAPASLRNSSATILGGIDLNTPNQSTLKVEFDTIQMVCADAGIYKCSYTYDGTDNVIHTFDNTRNLSVYALPSDLDIVATVDGTTRAGTELSHLQMAIGRTISFSCNGKIGSDTTNTIRWQITSRINEGQFNLHNPTPTTINDGTVSATPVDCSYSRTSTMTYVTTVEDSSRLAKLAFKCTTTVSPPGSQQYTTESEVFYIDVLSSINLDISPSTVVLQSKSPPKTSFECNDISASDMSSIAKIELSMVPELGNEQMFAIATPGSQQFTTETAPASLDKSSATVLGGIDTNQPTQSTLKVEFDTIQMVCADAGTYKCSYTYDGIDNVTRTGFNTRNLSVYALPSNLDLVATVDGTTRVGTQLSHLQMAINRTISFSCNGKIGSDTSNTIRWQMTSRRNEGVFNYLDPTPSTINDGTVSATPVDCSYSRKSTMTYVTTLEDSNRIAKLAFKCTTTVTPPGLQPYTTESEVFYVRVLQNKSVKGYPSIIPLICSIIAVWLVAN